MHTTCLRKVGGSVMLAVPPALLDVLNLSVGKQVGLAVDGERLLVIPAPPARPRYALDDLLAQCDAAVSMDAEDLAWLDAKASGNELI